MVVSQAHTPVLYKEALDALAVSGSGIYIDGTFGRGGHSEAILRLLDDQGRLIAIDKDPEAVQFARHRLGADHRFEIEQGSFAMLQAIAEKYGVDGEVDGVMLDLGVSSPQLDKAERGFSFLQDGPLDMRMDNSAGMSAAEWIATAKPEVIAGVLREYGEERFARRIAGAIAERRETQPITTTLQLAEIVSAANPAWEKGKHPATRTFQAIRIHLNRELDDLQQCLRQALGVLRKGGRLVVISFHSLEDRIVKRFMRDEARGPQLPPGVPVTGDQIQARLKRVGKAIQPGEEEIARNPRARSAVMRVAESLI